MSTVPALFPTAPIHGLHHFAYRCKDAEETRHFYEDILGLPLYHIIKAITRAVDRRVLPVHAYLFG